MTNSARTTSSIDLRLWDGKFMGNGILAVHLQGTASYSVTEPPKLLFGVVTDGSKHQTVLRQTWSKFLVEHAGATIVCHDAAETHWMLCDLFKATYNNDAAATLWGFSSNFRLIDVSLLDRELRRVQGDGFST